MPDSAGAPVLFQNPTMKTSETKEQLIPPESSSSDDDTEAQQQQQQQQQQQEQQQKPLSLVRKILFGLAAPPLQMTGNICGFFFSLFLLEVVHMSPLLVSVITFSGRAWDAVTDPLVGQLVFRTKTRIGRTKPWMMAASIVGPTTFFFMWFHVSGLDSSLQKFFYYFVCYLAYCTAITCYHVPYTSSTVLISNRPADRDGATAARIGFELVFTIIGSGVFGVIISQKRLTSNCKLNGTGNGTLTMEERVIQERQGYMLAAGIIAGFYFLCGIFAVAGIKERTKVKRLKDSFFKNIRSVLRFRPYYLLMLAFLFMSLGIQIVQANLGLYTTHSMKLGHQMQYGIFTVLSVAVLCVPFWYKMAERFGKKKIFICGLVPMYPCLLFATFMPEKSMVCYYLVCAVSGLSISVAMLLPWSMLPDVIDDFYVQTGCRDRKESVFYSLYVFFTKFASGISLALSQLALSASGYNSDSKACEQPESVGKALRYLVGPGPVLCIAASMILMWCYPIDKAYRENINRQMLPKEVEVVPMSEGSSAEQVADIVCPTVTDVGVETEAAAKPDTQSSGSGGSADSGWVDDTGLELRSTDNLMTTTTDAAEGVS